MNRCLPCMSSSIDTQRAKRLREREQSKCVAGRRGVDDDARVRRRRIGEQVGEREQREDLVAPGERRVDEAVDVVAIEIRAAIDDVGDRVAPARRGNRSRSSAAESWRASRFG